MQKRPISTLTEDDGYVLLIGDSGYSSYPERAIVGRYAPKYHPSNPYVDYSGQSFSEGGTEVTHWIPIPWVGGGLGGE